jgi:hypothetical protein
LTALVLPRTASASSGAEAENRVKGFLLVAPTLVGGSHAASAGKHLGKSNAYDENASGSCLAAGAAPAVNNAIPGELARVIPGEGPWPTLGPPGRADVFVTAAEDIEGLSASEIPGRLGIPASDTYTVVRFPTPEEGLASPVFRTDPGFVGRGLTSGGAREFVIQNGPIPANATVGLVQ